MSSSTLRQRYISFEENILKNPNGCWLWKARLTADGYGRYYRDNRVEYAHRRSYELNKGEIPNGFVIDHLCRNRACVNPNHLEAVPNRVNIQRGDTFAMGVYNRKKTHCKWGHPFDEQNTYRDSRGKRGCKICRNKKR